MQDCGWLHFCVLLPRLTCRPQKSGNLYQSLIAVPDQGNESRTQAFSQALGSGSNQGNGTDQLADAGRNPDRHAAT